MTLAIDCAGERLQLLPDRAVFWPAAKLLLIADLHLGKSDFYGRAGVPIPHGSDQKCLQRLHALVEQTSARHLMLLGDVVHDLPNQNESWLQDLSRAVDGLMSLGLHGIRAVRGNHDRSGVPERLDTRISWYQRAVTQAPFVFQHEPGSCSNGYVLCGHLHPAVRLQSSRRRSVRSPAFWFQGGCGVLPAFGEFTGGKVISPNAGDRVYAVGPEHVVSVPEAAYLPVQPRSRSRRA